MKAEAEIKSQGAKLLDSAIVACLFLFVAAVPHSIAATQIAWLVGMLLWLLRFAFFPRPKLVRTPVDYFLLGFFILTGVTAFLSYEPLVSIGKLRAASLFTVVYLFLQNIPSTRVLRLLAIVLVASCSLNILYTAGERAMGRGVKVNQVLEHGPLYAAGVRSGDTLLKVDGEKLTHPQQLINALAKPERKPAEVLVYRYEWQPTLKIPRGSALPGNDELQQLGIAEWSSGRDWRASGFFGLYVTYAEVLQLIGSIALALFLCLPRKRSWLGALLIAALLGFIFALLLTITRAVWLGFLVSTITMLVFSVRRRTLLILAALALPLILGGLFVLKQKRNVGFLDRRDASTTWRETVWREGVDLLVRSPRHLLVGVGMDSLKAHWREWELFDQGRIPRGHMHSNLLQIALERGLPALLVWLALLFVYARSLWRSLRSKPQPYWVERAILLGALGGLAGFFVSGLVHYNWGDSEVVTVFYLLMGLSLTGAQASRLQ